MAEHDLVPFYDGHTDTKIEQDLQNSYLRTQFKRSLYSATIRPALGYLGDGVNTIQDKIHDVLSGGKVHKIATADETAISAQEAEVFLKGRAQLRDDGELFNETVDEKTHNSEMLGDDLYEEAMYGMAMTTVLVEPELNAQCTWLGQFLATPSDTEMNKNTQIYVDMHMFTPSASDKSAKAMAEGPGADMMACMWDWCEDFQVSRMLRLAFDIGSINTLWYQVSSDSGSSEAAVLTLEVHGEIQTSTRRVNCKTTTKNEWRKFAGMPSWADAELSAIKLISLGGNCSQVDRLVSVLLALDVTLRDKVSYDSPPQRNINEKNSEVVRARKTTPLCAASHTIPPRCQYLPTDEVRDGIRDDASDSENEYEWRPNTTKSENSMSEIMSILMRAGYDPDQESPKSFMENSDVNPNDLPEACRFM
ncbi:hypothetical protein SARC_02551 [Sphaeroforma arctica JP610]|uniref:Uncharacterized protein n=1 Tax=Sphaeroforma arctica JP610 TaxID=667725 RepID=A0A0L0G8C9_9EUKA|nr:hypothetical protein SARC_02551 [Sphaeroforma arctica JP610]KNC85255.1 hypothetical protein SARC_02551 [Sphaeroforma arctica JP610]|eukprot:XP_014159157.1 hypothetical protein SARC_02551 [Sphaeroforma arctica JP610]